jgi:RNA polymerase sigma-70 factor (ECF subfamily)
VVPGVSGGRELDAESARWVEDLRSSGRARELALARLHALLLRVARSELRRREGRHPVAGPELDDLAHQAADDALVAVMAKLGRFRGESRFTTWAYKFAVLEVSAKLGRHFWQRPAVTLEAGQWDQLPDRLGLRPDELAEHAELLAALRRAVAEDLTERQRHVFTAIVVDGVPLDALVAQLGSSRNAIYKTMFDARRKLRAALAANGYLAAPADGPADQDWVRRSS